jgi:hypothetical protein
VSGAHVGNTRAPRTRPLPVKTLVVRPGGNDGARGDVAAPLATLLGALDRIPSVIDDARWRIDITGISDVAGGARWFMPPKLSTLPTDTLIDGSGAYLQQLALAPITIFATPSVFATLVVTGTASDGTNGLCTLTTSNNFTLNALRGKVVRGSQLGEAGVIVSNTAGPNSLVYVTAPAGFTAPVQVLDQTATLALGDLAETYNYIALLDTPCDVAFSGIKFLKTNNVFGISLLSRRCRLNLELCDIQGWSIESSPSATIYASYIHDGFFAGEDVKLTVQQSYFRALGMRMHEAGGQFFGQSVFENCDPLGHYIDFTRGGGFSIDSCDIVSPKTDGSGAACPGVTYRGGNHGRVRQTKINGASQGIYTEGPGYILVQQVVGTNVDVGIDIHDGTQVKAAGLSNTVTGGAGDVRVGTAGVKTYGQLPFTDTTQLVRAS